MTTKKSRRGVTMTFNTPTVRRLVDRVQSAGQSLVQQADARFGGQVRRRIAPTVAKLHHWCETEPATPTKRTKRKAEQPEE
jgi:hypothetical protein